MDTNQLLSTPISQMKHHLCKVTATTPAGRRSPAVRIPPTPFLKRLGYGTGVDVFLYERSPAKNGKPFSPWALKRVQRERGNAGDVSARLDLEATVLKRLNHPNIIGYRGYKTLENGHKVLAMEAGQQSLTDLIDDRNDTVCEPFAADKIEKTIYACAKALNYLHVEKNLLHGDLKSGNILIKNDFDEVKLCDFGVTIPLDQNLNAVSGHHYVGTNLWSAPEIIEDSPFSNKADIFALGLVIYEMLSLDLPHVNDNDLDSSVEDSEASLIVIEDKDDDEDLPLGTRPALPEDIDYGDEYKRVLEIYFATTQEEPEKRPSAKDIVDLFENQ